MITITNTRLTAPVAPVAPVAPGDGQCRDQLIFRARCL